MLCQPRFRPHDGALHEIAMALRIVTNHRNIPLD